MIIFGVDPGTNLTGFGIIKQDGSTFSLIKNGVIKLSSNNSLPNKLVIIYNELLNLIKLYKPDEFAIETAFYGRNVQSAMKIGYARGAAILAAAHCKVPMSEYSPREIKKSVVGKGAASKEQVSYMIKTLLSVKEKKMRFDESDALAVALCHAFRMGNHKKHGKDWKSFIEQFPERIMPDYKIEKFKD
ncbi:MAG: crossover junction endodeoxyribonuclease RuvC [Ignavibacteria bacterium RBG_16_34_14]|nr:MAG: crossover junction endodeoxyribonuclease RuvC [Ignavibacteria bacterium RBG_16_34_14]